MATFATLFGRAPAFDASAPGRVNLIGEHTDYNGGFVLPTAVPQRTTVELARRDDREVRVASAAGADADEIRAYRLGEEQAGGDWLDYVQGCTVSLARDGHRIGGFEARVVSTVPIGSGLSSSAALEVSLLRALRAAWRLAVDDVTLALIAHRAEHDFVGARVGIMDQMAASLADERTALLLDTETLAHERVPLPPPFELVVIDSGITHQHATGGYNTRREECERAAALLGVRSLRAVGRADLTRVMRLPEPLGRRVRHVVTENERVHAAVAALRAGAVGRLGTLLLGSHASLRDDYEVSLPAIDRLVALAVADRAVYGARLTGGGFGGAVIALVHAGTGADASAHIARAYERETGHAAPVLVASMPARTEAR